VDPDGYHFVRQGKVTEIVEQSDVARRKVVDELSGVAKFDEKKMKQKKNWKKLKTNYRNRKYYLMKKTAPEKAQRRKRACNPVQRTRRQKRKTSTIHT